MDERALNRRLQLAVRDGIARAAGVIGLCGMALIHVIDAPSHGRRAGYQRRERAVKGTIARGFSATFNVIVDGAEVDAEGSLSRPTGFP